MTTKDRERERPRPSASPRENGGAPMCEGGAPMCDARTLGARDAAAARSSLRVLFAARGHVSPARTLGALALAFTVAASAASCVVSPAGNSNGNASQTNAANASAAANSSTAAATPPLEVSPFPKASATPEPGASPAPAPPQSEPTPEGAGANIPAALLIPVAGIRAEDLRDTFTEARSEGRVHNSIDIIAPKGTPVLAAADGRVVKLFQSDKGGTTIYQRGADGKTIYYYAHLDRYADGLAENKELRRGEVIGYVGDTGNATPGNHHLHFSIWITEDPKRYWDGINLNPYPLLTGKK